MAWPAIYKKMVKKNSDTNHVSEFMILYHFFGCVK